MNNTTINIINSNNGGLNISQLKQSQIFNKDYECLWKENNKVETSTQSYGNDVGNIFKVAIINLLPNEIQNEILNSLQEKLIFIEKQIDPDRLLFSITKAMDDEICINRNASSGGRVKLIVNDDGVITLSYLPDKNSKKEKVLDFYSKENVDFENLVYQIFSF